MTVLLLPVHEPSTHLTELVAAWDGPVVVVDDGSEHGVQPVHALHAHVLRHERNRGKGAALKTGFRHIITAHPGEDVVCADGDGQHRLDDIRRVAAHVAETGRLTLGVRRFDGRVPFRSRLGNRLTTRLFHARTGRYVSDTQTGLRGFPAERLEWLCAIPGERFEYEMAMLLAAAKQDLPIDEVPIATVYLGSSQFGPLADSVRIYRSLLF